jgi:hypothetical protein
MSEPIQRSSALNGLIDGAKKAPPPPGPRETKRPGGAASALLERAKMSPKMDKNVAGIKNEAKLFKVTRCGAL